MGFKSGTVLLKDPAIDYMSLYIYGFYLGVCVYVMYLYIYIFLFLFNVADVFKLQVCYDA